MKWFQHETDAYAHPYVHPLVSKFRGDGYYGYFGTLEIIGKYCDTKLCLSLEKCSLKWISEQLRIDENILQQIWESMFDNGVLSRKHYQKGVLFSPGLKERCDEYTKKLRRKYGQDTDNVRLHNNTLHNIILHYITAKRLTTVIEGSRDLRTDFYRRNCKPAKRLYVITGQNMEITKQAITELGQQFDKASLSWTLETIIKHLPDWLKTKKSKSPALQRLEELLAEQGVR